MSDFPVGTKVRATNPDDFISSVSRQLRNRIGVVARHQHYSGRPIVVFGALGRRREFQWVPPRDDDIELVADSADKCKAACEVDRHG